MACKAETALLIQADKVQAPRPVGAAVPLLRRLPRLLEEHPQRQGRVPALVRVPHAHAPHRDAQAERPQRGQAGAGLDLVVARQTEHTLSCVIIRPRCASGVLTTQPRLRMPRSLPPLIRGLQQGRSSLT
jgi:hypothetical protein